MRRATRGRARIAVMLTLVALAASAHAQVTPRGPTTTPSGSYLNLQPRRQSPPLPAPNPRARVDATTVQRAPRQVVCGLTVITPPAGIDDEMVKLVPKDGPQPTIRTVDPPLCGSAR